MSVLTEVRREFSASSFARALNHWRVVHRPTYVAIRLLAQQCDNTSIDEREWVPETLVRKLAIRTNPRYWPFLSFKRVEDGKPEYRSMLASSPTTALVEAWALDCLAGEQAFAKCDRVFSYRWPENSRSRRSYAWYMDGYNAFQRGIGDRLSRWQASVAVVVDATRFYPSIRREFARNQFARRLNGTTLGRHDRNHLMATVEGYLHASSVSGGLGIGPAISHAMADTAVADMDTALSGLYGDSYFRYVDDIVVVCRRDEADRVRSTVEAELRRLSIDVNRKKSDTVTRDEWLTHSPATNPNKRRVSFESLEFRTVVWLARGGDAAELDSAFRSAGLRLPVARLQTRSRSARVAAFIATLLERATFFDKVDDLVSRAMAVRRGLWEELTHTIDAQPEGVTRRRWWEGRLRYCASRLLYLVPRGQLHTLRGLLGHRDACQETCAAIDALLTGNLAGVLPFHGPTTATVGVLATSYEIEPLELQEEPLDDAARAAVGDLALNGLIRFTTTPKDPLVRFALGLPSAVMQESSLGYTDEIGSLLRGALMHHPEATVHLDSIIRSRRNHGDLWHLDAFGLGADYD